MSDLGVLVPILAPSGFGTRQSAATSTAERSERTAVSALSGGSAAVGQNAVVPGATPVDPLTGLARTSLNPSLIGVLQEIQNQTELTAGSTNDAGIAGEADADGAESQGDISSNVGSGSGTEPTNLTPEQQQVVQELERTDGEVRRHEQAHASAGGPYAGAPSYDYTRGPNGRLYAIGGDVQIDAAPIPGNPEATIQKMQIVRRAALAPASPSPQDQRVAAIAQQRITEARREKVDLELEERQEAAAVREEEASGGVLGQPGDQSPAIAGAANTAGDAGDSSNGAPNTTRQRNGPAQGSAAGTSPDAIAGTIFNIIA